MSAERGSVTSSARGGEKCGEKRPAVSFTPARNALEDPSDVVSFSERYAEKRCAQLLNFDPEESRRFTASSAQPSNLPPKVNR
jgi:hypothetical protein